MPGQLQPLSPPSEPNYSHEALVASEAVLPDSARKILEENRARLAQTSAAAAFTLGETLGLSGDSAKELAQKLTERLGRLSPTFHQYVNQVIGNVVTVITGQHNPGEPQQTFIGVLKTETNTALLPTALKASDQNTRLTVQNNTISVVPETVPAPSEQVVTKPSAEAEHQQPAGTTEQKPDPEVEKTKEGEHSELVLQIPDGIRFFKHAESPPRSVRVFVDAVFPNLKDQIASLSPEEFTLVGWQLVEYYKRQSIPRINTEAKAEHLRRMVLALGLFGPYVTQSEIAERLKVRHNSISVALSRARSRLNELMGESGELILQKARATAAKLNHDELFTDIDLSQKLNRAPSFNLNSSSDTSDNTVDKSQATETVPADLPRPYYEYPYGVPANMRNFLYDVMPVSAENIVTNLNTYQACWLTEKLLEKYKSVEKHGVVKERVLSTERWTGLYEEAQDLNSIAKRRVRSYAVIKNDIDSVKLRLKNNVSKQELRKLADEARTVTKARSRTTVNA